VAERRLRNKHAALHCTFPSPGRGLVDAWQNEDGSWETDHPAYIDRAVGRDS
jgi:hypothetical protein